MGDLSWLRVTVSEGRNVTAAASDGSTTDEEKFRLPAPLDRVVDVLDRLLRNGKYGDDDGVALLGGILYDSIFVGDVKRKFLELFADANERRPLLLRIEVQNESLDNLPWEHLYCPLDGGFHLASTTRVLLTRYHGTKRPSNRTPISGRNLRVLFAIALADDMLSEIVDELDPDGEFAHVKRRAQRLARSDVDPPDEVLKRFEREKSGPTVGYLRDFIQETLQNPHDKLVPHRIDHPVTFQKLDAAIRHQPPPDVVHFVGHGRIHDGNPQLGLVARDGDQTDWRRDTDVVTLLRQREPLGDAHPAPDVDQLDADAEADRRNANDAQPQPALVVLHLCQGGLGTFDASFRKLAPRLLDTGIDAVVAMQYPVKSEKARIFVEELYRQLAKGRTIEEAVQRGRREVYHGTMYEASEAERFYRDYAAPILYTRYPSGLVLVEPPPQPTSPPPGTTTTTQPPPVGGDTDHRGRTHAGPGPRDQAHDLEKQTFSKRRPRS